MVVDASLVCSTYKRLLFKHLMHQLCCHKGRKGVVVLLFNIKVWVHHRLFSHFKSRHGILKFGEICESMWGVQVSWMWEAETGVFFTVSALFLWFCQVLSSMRNMHYQLTGAHAYISDKCHHCPCERGEQIKCILP